MSSLLNPSSKSSSSNEYPLRGERIAVLVANGFNEHEFLQSLRALQATGATLTIIAPLAGLVQGWNGTTFGHSHAVEVSLSTALAADFSMLLVPSGVRSVEKLKSYPQTTRFIKSFISYGNPVAFMGEAVSLMVHVGMDADMTGSDIQADLNDASTKGVDEAVTISGQILTARTDTPDMLAQALAAVVAHFSNIPDNLRLAA